jgi:hypothetical protein
MKRFLSVLNRLNPAVNKYWLLFAAGLVWSGVGIMLCWLAFIWLEDFHSAWTVWIIIAGLILSVVIYFFGFLRITRSNIDRLRNVVGKVCVFAFFPWKSYLIMIMMMTMGMMLRHSAIPKPYLSILYESIGGGLFFSSLHYYPPAVIRVRG